MFHVCAWCPDQRGHWIPQDHGYIVLSRHVGAGSPNQGPLEEQPVLLTAEHLSSPSSLVSCAYYVSFISLRRDVLFANVSNTYNSGTVTTKQIVE